MTTPLLSPAGVDALRTALTPTSLRTASPNCSEPRSPRRWAAVTCSPSGARPRAATRSPPWSGCSPRAGPPPRRSWPPPSRRCRSPTRSPPAWSSGTAPTCAPGSTCTRTGMTRRPGGCSSDLRRPTSGPAPLRRRPRARHRRRRPPRWRRPTVRPTGARPRWTSAPAAASRHCTCPRHARRVTATDLNRPRAALRRDHRRAQRPEWELLARRHGRPGRRAPVRPGGLATRRSWSGPGRTTHVYRDSGRPGDAICAELVAAAPKLLTDGGWLQLLANWVHVEGEDWEERVAGWFAGTGLRRLGAPARGRRPDGST